MWTSLGVVKEQNPSHSPGGEGNEGCGYWGGLPASLTDITHQGHSPGKDVQNGDHGEEEAAVRAARSLRSSKLRSSSCAGAGDRSIGQVARDFDLTETNVRTWVKQAEIDQGERPGLTTEERAELSKLRRENCFLREDVEILKRATAFFAEETR